MVNVLAIQRGTSDPDRYVVMSGDSDSRVSDALAACASHAGLSESTPTTRRRARLNQTPPGERDATRKYQVQVSQ